MRLLFLLFFLTLNIYSQRVLIKDMASLSRVTIDSLNNQYILYYPDHYEKIDLETFEKKIFPWITNGNLYIPMIMDNINYFISHEGGMVAVLENDTIKRIDQSFNHRMQHGAVLFNYNSRFIKYGGYGFWSDRNFFTYFDGNTKEWEVVDPINSKEMPEGTSEGYHILDDDDVYLFGGQKINSHRRKERILNDEVWKFNLKEHKWDFLGETSFVGSLNWVKYKNKILFLGQSNITEIDVVNNTKTLYEHGLISPRISRVYYFNNRFYGLINDKGNYYFQVVEEKDFLGKKISERGFYKNYTWWITLVLLYILLPILFLFGSWKLFMNFKKNKKITLLDNGLRFENRFTEFDKESMEIIKLLLSKDEIYSNQILRIVEKEQYSPAHNERLKVQKLNEINLKVKMLLEINEDIINSFKSKNDRRIRIYTISDILFNKTIDKN